MYCLILKTSWWSTIERGMHQRQESAVILTPVLGHLEMVGATEMSQVVELQVFAHLHSSVSFTERNLALALA